MIRLDEETSSRSNLHKTRILIKTPCLKIPRTPFVVFVDGRNFYIRVKEEVEGDDSEIDDWGSDDICEVDEDDSLWIQETDLNSDNGDEDKMNSRKGFAGISKFTEKN
ncbi:hypothetical protein ACS0TY_012120 [Phlomoides rotata]